MLRAAMTGGCAIARSDTGQSRRVADFLLACWNGQDLGHFPIEHIWNVDRTISADMVTIPDYFAQQPCAVHANAFGFADEMNEPVPSWRPVDDEAPMDTISQAGACNMPELPSYTDPRHRTPDGLRSLRVTIG